MPYFDYHYGIMPGRVKKNKNQSHAPRGANSKGASPVKPDNDHLADPKLVERARARHMTSVQEFWNGITMLLPMLICLDYVLSGKWVTDADIRVTEEAMDSTFLLHNNNKADLADDVGCIQSNMFPKLYAVPPIATLCIVIGFFVHSPFALYYHFACAFQLPPGLIRFDHWSRRMDQAMIHVLGMFWSYGLSGNLKYSLALIAFNVDSIYHLWQKDIRPKNSFYRQVILIASWLLPLLMRGEWSDFFLVTIIYAIGGWIFAVYPFGGWSHTIMHFVLILSNPIFLASSAKLSSSKESITLAATCALLRGENL